MSLKESPLSNHMSLAQGDQLSRFAQDLRVSWDVRILGAEEGDSVGQIGTLPSP